MDERAMGGGEVSASKIATSLHQIHEMFSQNAKPSTQTYRGATASTSPRVTSFTAHDPAMMLARLTGTQTMQVTQNGRIVAARKTPAHLLNDWPSCLHPEPDPVKREPRALLNCTPSHLPPSHISLAHECFAAPATIAKPAL